MPTTDGIIRQRGQHRERIAAARAVQLVPAFIRGIEAFIGATSRPTDREGLPR